MKPFFAVLLLVVGLCVACEIRPTNSQSSTSKPAAPSPTPTIKAEVSKSPCSLAMDQAPVLSGLRLGMTPDQVTAIFPGSKDDGEVRAALARPPSPLGVTSLIMRPDKFGSKEKFVGVTQITFDLLDGHVSAINVGYNGPEYPHVDKFVEKFTEGSSLPTVDAWEAYVGLDTQMKTLKCQDFEIQIFAGGEGGNLNYVRMRDLAADKTLKERRAKAKEAKAKEKATP